MIRFLIEEFCNDPYVTTNHIATLKYSEIHIIVDEKITLVCNDHQKSKQRKLKLCLFVGVTHLKIQFIVATLLTITLDYHKLNSRHFPHL